MPLAAVMVLLAAIVAACGAGPSGTFAPASAPAAGASDGGRGSLAAPTLAPPDGSGLGTADAPVAFTKGTARLVLSGGTTERLELPAVAPLDSVFDPIEGVTVVWRDAGSGWYVTLSGYYRQGTQPTGDPGPYLEIRSADDRHVQDLAGLCSITVDVVDRAGFRGSAACAGLRWQDADDAPTGDPFDASFTFRATP